MRLVATQYLSDKFAIPFLGFGRSLNVALPLLQTKHQAQLYAVFCKDTCECKPSEKIAIAVKRPKAQTLLFLLTFRVSF